MSAGGGGVGGGAGFVSPVPCAPCSVPVAVPEVLVLVRRAVVLAQVLPGPEQLPAVSARAPRVSRPQSRSIQQDCHALFPCSVIDLRSVKVTPSMTVEGGAANQFQIT